MFHISNSFEGLFIPQNWKGSWYTNDISPCKTLTYHTSLTSIHITHITLLPYFKLHLTIQHHQSEATHYTGFTDTWNREESAFFSLCRFILFYFHLFVDARRCKSDDSELFPFHREEEEEDRALNKIAINRNRISFLIVEPRSYYYPSSSCLSTCSILIAGPKVTTQNLLVRRHCYHFQEGEKKEVGRRGDRERGGN